MSERTILCLSTGTTARDLSAWLRAHEHIRITDFLLRRFEERYFTPILSMDREKKNGFLVMAISCLTIEALETFRQGWKSSARHSEEAFKCFLTRETRFIQFSTYAESFYKGVRCGILHQGETYAGWKIRRKGPLFDEATLTINATRFHSELRGSLHEYVEELKVSDFKSKLWKRARRKLSNLIANCEREGLSS